MIFICTESSGAKNVDAIVVLDVVRREKGRRQVKRDSKVDSMLVYKEVPMALPMSRGDIIVDIMK